MRLLRLNLHIAGVRVIPYYLLARRYSKAHFYIHAHSSKNFASLSRNELSAVKVDQRINRNLSELPIGCGELAIKSIYSRSTNPDDMMIVPNSIDIDSFVFTNKSEHDQFRNKYRKKYNIADDELLIGQIGRLRKVKNHEKTIEIAKQLKKQNKKVKILFIGEGEREAELKQMVQTNDLEDMIYFTGRINPIYELYPALDLMIMPSFSEGLPTVVVEAQVAGVPVVLSDTITEEVDFDLGMLAYVPLNSDSNDWVKAIDKISTNDFPNAMERKKIAENKKFSNEASAKLYADFLRGNIKHFTIS